MFKARPCCLNSSEQPRVSESLSLRGMSSDASRQCHCCFCDRQPDQQLSSRGQGLFCSQFQSQPITEGKSRQKCKQPATSQPKGSKVVFLLRMGSHRGLGLPALISNQDNGPQMRSQASLVKRIPHEDFLLMAAEMAQHLKVHPAVWQRTSV